MRESRADNITETMYPGIFGQWCSAVLVYWRSRLNPPAAFSTCSSLRASELKTSQSDHLVVFLLAIGQLIYNTEDVK